MKDSAQVLQKLGFGDYEARAYVGLLQRSPMTGYELAKVTGIPRANIYEILPRLEERGAVMRLDSSSGARYSAIPPSELMPRLADRFNADLVAAEKALAEPVSRMDQDYAWNVESYRAVLDHARTLIDSAEKEILIAIWPQEAGVLARDVAKAEKRGVSITTLCLNACARECGGCQGSIFRYRVSPDDAVRWLIVAIDGREMLSAAIDKHDNAQGVRTTQHLLIELAGWYIRNSVALVTLVSELGDQLPDLLSPEARSILASLGPDVQSGGWLEHMHEVVSRSRVA